MSSRFAAAICGHVIRRQTALGMTGDLLEIGTFEGRFFVAMALLLRPGEHASYAAWKADTRTIAPADLRARLPGGAARFIHVDGEHDAECLTRDLELAHAVLHADGVIAIDDMLHPGYPTLITTVLDHLARHPDMRVLCIIDRESVTAAAKFLICRVDRVAKYERDLMTCFAKFHYVLGADVMGHFTLVLTPDPTLPKVD